ncbi:MAG: peptidase [Desulfobacteraceae bacterium 4572_35.2]|nr:MAG: peptidase [Desulfobacteraceae bacterium 4572_35.2]
MKRITISRLILALIVLVPATGWSHTPDFVALTKQLKPAVVNISTTLHNQSTPSSDQQPSSIHRDFFEEFFNNFLQEYNGPHDPKKSLGSGFIISDDGYILTNAHVVDNADEIKVQIAGGAVFSATVQGVDPKLDLALLKIETDEKLPTVTLGNSDKLEIGEWVMAIGNPFGLQQTVTVGIVSAKGRVLGAGPYDNFIQTDASINPGNSGGPLFNTHGAVVGINAAIVSGAQGLGFAIPINTAKHILPQLKATGHVTRGWLGITIQKVSKDLADSFGLATTKGALISSITENSPAQQAGLRRGDIIMTLNQHQIETINDLPRLVADIAIGDTATIGVYRDGTIINITVMIGQQNGEEKIVATPVRDNPLGITTMDLSDKIKRRLNIQADQGVVITSVIAGGVAEQAKLLAGDVIVEYNNQQISSQFDLNKAITSDNHERVQRLLIQRGNGLFFTTLNLK